MSKKRRWFDKGIWGAQIDTDKNSNAIAKHTERLSKQGRMFDEDGFEILDEDSYGSYNWDLDRKLSHTTYQETGNKKEDRKNKYGMVQSDYAENYNSYEKTGVWRGYSYYQQPQLSYKYVQQMANILSAQHNVKVEVGNEWVVDLLQKTLTYNPASLIYGTKSELLATLMHEIGKLRYVTHSSLLNNKYLTMYQLPAKEVLSIYEDLRTDFLMLKAYEGASEIYESVLPTIEEQVRGYMRKGSNLRELTSLIPENILQNIIQSHCDNQPNHELDENNPELRANLLQTFGVSDLSKVRAGMVDLKGELQSKGTIYEYCGEMLSLMYDLDEQGHMKYENITEKVNLTLDTIDASKKSEDSQKLVDYMDEKVYPVIEELLKDAKDKTDAIEKAFPKMPAAQKKLIANGIEQYLQMQGRAESGSGSGVDDKGNMKVRMPKGLSRNNNSIPPEWESGDYKVLRDSVAMEIKQLVNRLTFLRRDELTVRYTADQKRGKLNSKKLYKKASSGSRRLFKQKLENTDTIQSFAFSVLLDVSGSMSGARITHSTRALVIFAEVFKKMDIPFEIATFSNGAKTIKPFGTEMTKKMEKSIGGLVNCNGGGTNLNQGLEQLKIRDQKEKNKIVIVLTDGDVGRPEEFDNKYFIPWKKLGIKSVGFGLECSDSMARLAMGNSKVLRNASALPVEFSNLLKTLIKR